mmetsp:Transcript_25445/g.83717  ORF Transcript_25445/g.83717 Transcript_25445/m.83717 type:complete len:225 (-) Transcript_25445:1246-1920(-)
MAAIHRVRMRKAMHPTAGTVEVATPAQRMRRHCCTAEPVVLPACDTTTSIAALPLLRQSAPSVMYTISSAGLKSANFDARASTTISAPTPTSAESIAGEPSNHHARASASETKAPPTHWSTRGIADAARPHPQSAKMLGEQSMSAALVTPVSVATSPKYELYSAGVGARSRRCDFHKTSSRFIVTPCAAAHTARHVTAGLDRITAKASASPCFGSDPEEAISSA